MTEKWKAFDLSSVVSDCQAKCQQIEETKKLSLESKKRLAEETKEFRKKTNEEIVVDYTILLKSYQQEIDSLSRRAKLSESNYQQLVASLSSLPDPSSLEDSSASLRAQLRNLEKEFGELTNQQLTVRRLEADMRCLTEDSERRLKDKDEQIASLSSPLSELSNCGDKLNIRNQEYEAIQRELLAFRNRHDTADTTISSLESEIHSCRLRFSEALREKDEEIDTIRRSSQEVAASGRPDEVTAVLANAAHARAVEAERLLRVSNEQIADLYTALQSAKVETCQALQRAEEAEARETTSHPTENVLVPSLVALAVPDDGLKHKVAELEVENRRISGLLAELSKTQESDQQDILTDQGPSIAILQSQRERLRQRTSDLEIERDTLRKQVDAFKVRVDVLQTEKQAWRPQAISGIDFPRSKDGLIYEGVDGSLTPLDWLARKRLPWKAVAGYFFVVHVLLVLLLFRLDSLGE